MSQDQICAHERMLDVHDYCPDCGELRTSWLLEGAKLRARIAELEASNAALREAAEGALHALESSRVFVTSRERIHKPDGESWYDERVAKLRAALKGDL